MGSVFFKSGKDKVLTKVQSFFDLSAKDIDGNLISFSTFKQNKAFIVVNVASSCSFTRPAYKELVKLYDDYHDKGLEILGFPCNQFMSQESKCEVDIKLMAITTYGVKFPLFSKIEVNGPECHEVYKFLRTQSDLRDQKTDTVKEIPWNFSKFLLDRNGIVMGFYPPTVKPSELAPEIEKLLK